MSDWHPAHKLNLLTGSAIAFRNVVKTYEKWRSEQPKGEFTLTTGWHVITPQMAEELLKRNFKNRNIHFPTVVAYAVQLINGTWKKTGQPLIFTADEELLDGQHRLWACYLTGKSFETFVITDVPPEEHLFAFVDNNKPRTGGDALETAGLNGLARHVAAVVNNLAHRADQNALTIQGRISLARLAHHEVLGYMQDNPELLDAAKYVEDNYKTAKTKLGPEIATFIAWKAMAFGGTEMLDQFMEAMTQSDLPAGHPIRLLRTLINPDAPKLTKSERDRIGPRVKITKMGTNMALAYAIVAFNALQQSQIKLKELMLPSSFPEIEPPIVSGSDEPEAEAAQ